MSFAVVAKLQALRGKNMKRFAALFVLLGLSVLAQAQTVPVKFTFTSTASPCATIRAQNNATVGIIVGSTAFTGTLTPTLKIYGTGPSASTVVYPTGSNAPQATITANGGYSSSLSGFTEFDLCPTAFSSGTANVQLFATAVGAVSTGGGVSGTVTTIPPANASTNITQLAGATLVADPCQVNARISVVLNQTVSTQIITGTSLKQTYICFLQFSLSSASDNVALVEGTGSICATSIAGMAGGSTAATGWNLLANGSVTGGAIQNWAFKTATAADNVCLLVSSAAQLSGVIQYVQQ